jgi:pimeloyl-ACP methyl ester carboxylesterase
VPRIAGLSDSTGVETAAHASLLLMQRSGHLVHVEEPGAFFAAVEEFLSGRWPVAAEPISSL